MSFYCFASGIFWLWVYYRVCLAYSVFIHNYKQQRSFHTALEDTVYVYYTIFYTLML